MTAIATHPAAPPVTKTVTTIFGTPHRRVDFQAADGFHATEWFAFRGSEKDFDSEVFARRRAFAAREGSAIAVTEYSYRVSDFTA